MSDAWTEEQVRQHLARFNRPAVPAADVEPNPQHEPKAKNASQEVHQRFRINYHSKRWRRCDPDGVYSKAATDGLSKGGLLRDDNELFVEAVTYSQDAIPKDQSEETVIEIWEAK